MFGLMGLLAVPSYHEVVVAAECSHRNAHEALMGPACGRSVCGREDHVHERHVVICAREYGLRRTLVPRTNPQGQGSGEGRESAQYLLDSIFD